jgi:hypothetical protein
MMSSNVATVKIPRHVGIARSSTFVSCLDREARTVHSGFGAAGRLSGGGGVPQCIPGSAQVIHPLTKLLVLDGGSFIPLTDARADAQALQLAPILYTTRSIIVHRGEMSAAGS